LLSHVVMVMAIIAVVSCAFLCLTAITAFLALLRHGFRFGPSRPKLHWRSALASPPRICSNRAPTWSSLEVDQAIDSALATLVVEDVLAVTADVIDDVSAETVDTGSFVLIDEAAPDFADAPRLDAIVEALPFDFSEPTVADDVYSSADQIAAILAKESPPRPPKRTARGSLAAIQRMQTIRGVAQEPQARLAKLPRAISAITPS